MIIHLNLGSNIPPRHVHIDAAIEALRHELPGRYHISAPVDSPPWGYISPYPYINIGVMIEPECDSLPPEAILEATERAQAAVDPSPHRDSSGAYIDRRIDIDIIAIDSFILDTPRLSLPHPRMHLRPFVLRPLAQLDPCWVHPVLHLTAARMIADLDTPL